MTKSVKTYVYTPIILVYIFTSTNTCTILYIMHKSYLLFQTVIQRFISNDITYFMFFFCIRKKIFKRKGKVENI
jgi:hypothetical protein